MTEQHINVTLKALLIDHFDIKKLQFSWDLPLDQLDTDFRTLSYLVYLEQLINSKFKTKVSIIEKINTSVHTASDISNLIKNIL